MPGCATRAAAEGRRLDAVRSLDRDSGFYRVSLCGDGEDVRRCDGWIQPHVIHLPPPMLLAGELIGNEKASSHVDAESRSV